MKTTITIIAIALLTGRAPAQIDRTDTRLRSIERSVRAIEDEAAMRQWERMEAEKRAREAEEERLLVISLEDDLYKFCKAKTDAVRASGISFKMQVKLCRDWRLAYARLQDARDKARK